MKGGRTREVSSCERGNLERALEIKKARDIEKKGLGNVPSSSYQYDV